MSNDSELLRRYVEHGDQRSFADLVQRHVGIVFNAALRRANGNQDLAEEATQLVFTQLAAKAPRLMRHSALLGWLHTSTRYAVTVLIRREQRFAARHQTAAAMPNDDNERPDWESLRPFIDEFLDRLNGSQRDAVLLRFFAGHSFGEIGAELKMSENAARKCVERGVESLRRQFARRGITTSASALAGTLGLAPAKAATPPVAHAIATTAIANATAAHATLAASLLAFMTASKLSSTGAFVLSLIAVVGLGTAVATWSRQQDVERQQLDAWAAQTRTVKSRLERIARETRAAAIPSNAPARSANTTTQTRADLLQTAYQFSYTLATSPTFAPIRQQQYRLRFLHEYGGFVAGRNYSPGKVAALRDAVAEYYQAFYAHQAEATVDPAKLKQFHTTFAADEQALFDRLKPTFTEAEQADIRRCFQSQKAMPVAAQIGYSMEFEGHPLDRVQELALAMITTDGSNALRSAAPEQRKLLNQVDGTSGLSSADRKLLDDASVFLPPDQLGVYQEYLRLEEVRGVAMRRAQELYKQSHPKT